LNRLSDRLSIPIASSALLQIPSIRTFLTPSQLIGVLTYDGARLGSSHLEQLNIDPKTVHIRGMPADGHLRAVIQDGATYNEVAMEREMVAEARELMRGSPDIGALVLECTQMPPFAEAIQRAVKVPVYDVYTMGMWFYSGLVRRSPESWTQNK
jgi:Asp/Glu/hydantoin racemase